MKTHRKTLSAILLLILLVVGWRFWGVQLAPSKLQPSGVTTPAIAEATAPSPAQRYVPPAHTTVDISALADDPTFTAEQKTLILQDPGNLTKYIRFAQARFDLNTKPLDFYGKVVDQFGQPVSGVEVKGSILLAVSPIASANKEIVAETDAAGKFQFVGIQGADLGMILQKPGYESNGTSNWSKNRNLGPGDPVVFTLWKLQGAEPMLHWELDSRLPYDSQASTFGASFNLTTGKRDGAGDLRVTLTQNPLSVRRGVDHYDWSVKIEVVGGGLVEVTDLYKNLAPERGYQPAFVFAQAKVDPKWEDRFIKTFYVHTAKGQYGKVSVDLTPGSNRPDAGLGIGLTIESWLNPAGSRNLEFDPLKVVKP